MKKCPQCNQEYSDRTLEFCLEDGTRLISPVLAKISQETVVLQNLPDQPTSPVLPKTIPEKIKTNKVQVFKEKAVDQGYKVLEVAPIVLALAHNFWQWLYTDKYPTNQISDFLLSGSFILWLVLLLVGLIASFLTLKFGRNKAFAITGLIILAINFLLFIVPRK